MSTASPNPEGRRAVEAYVDKLMLTIDPGGSNAARYRKLFSKLSDAQFQRYVDQIGEGKRRLIVYAPNMKLHLRLEDILQAADLVGLELFERIRLWDPVVRRYMLTPHQYLVVMLPVRRLKQYLFGKMSVPDSDTTRNLLTGQVIKPDKGSSMSMVEVQPLLTKDLHATAIELMNIRGGNLGAYAELKANLQETGGAQLAELDTTTLPRSTVVSGAYLRAMMLENNLAPGT